MTPMLASGPVRMFRLSNEPGERGLSCTPDGVALAGVPLVRKTQAGFAPRPAGEIASLLKAAYGDRPMALQSRLGAIAQALNSGDFAMAMIAAVHTQTPELDAEAAIRLAHAEDRLTKYDYNPSEPRDWHGRWTSDGSPAPAPPTASTEADERTADANDRPRRIAENTFPPGGAVASDAPASSSGSTSTAPERSDEPGKPSTLEQTFEQKYDDLGPEDFSKKVIEFGHWLETLGRELSPAERERALAEYAFVQNRLSSRLTSEYASIWDPGYLRSAAQRLFQGASNSGLVPVSPLPPSMLDVVGTIALLETPSRGRRPATRPAAGASELLKPPETSGGAADTGGRTAAITLPERAAEIHNVLDPIAREMRTTAVLQTNIGRIIAGGVRDLTPAQRDVLSAGEIASQAPGVHAEITALAAAEKLRATPQELAVTRAICAECAAAIEASGGILTSSKTAIWPRP